MIEIRTKLRNWGNSFGIVVPINKIENADIKEGEEITAMITKENKTDLRKLFGKHKFNVF